MKITDSTIYLTDNGAAYCGAHLGSTAKRTGRDISGQAIEPITPEAAQDCFVMYGFLPSCETCGKVASTLHTASMVRTDGATVRVTIPQ